MKRIFDSFLFLIILFLVAFLIVKGITEKYFTPRVSHTSLSEFNLKSSLDQALNLLKNRQDSLALTEFEKILSSDPQNLTARWAKAEILRRQRKYSEAEALLRDILKQNPDHAPSLTSICYITYKDDKLDEAMKIAKRVLSMPNVTKEDQAITYLMIGSINSRKSSKGGLFSKIKYGTQIKGNFEKARNIAPDLGETHLGMGTFYLLAPAIVGGNLDKAIEELKLAVMLAPNFATANARLAQAYLKKGDKEKSQIYLDRAKKLDPENEVLREISRKNE